MFEVDLKISYHAWSYPKYNLLENYKFILHSGDLDFRVQEILLHLQTSKEYITPFELYFYKLQCPCTVVWHLNASIVWWDDG